VGKGANSGLISNSGTANRRGNKLTSNANELYGTLDPALTAEATNPQGYAPGDLAAMNTASQQSLGGATAGITGTANLEAARSRNAGGFQGAIGSGSRSAMKQNSQNALEVQAENARLKEAQKQQALSSLQSLYGVDTSTALGYLHGSNEALGTENESSGAKSFLDQYLLGAQKAAASAAAAGA
jgi:hypothetical protein